jgi:hypothetical protein
MLRGLFDKHGTDKGEYAKTYEILLGPIRNDVRDVLEIGIGSMLPGHSSMLGHMPASYRPGASLRAWREFFPSASIVGLDIQADTQFSDDRIVTFLADTASDDAPLHLRTLLEDRLFDIIVDDGSHDGGDQLHTLEACYPMLKPGGFYFVEDIAVGTLLFEEPRSIVPVVGGADYFYVTDRADEPLPPPTGLRAQLRRVLNGPAAPNYDEWRLLVIRKPT